MSYFDEHRLPFSRQFLILIVWVSCATLLIVFSFHLMSIIPVSVKLVVLIIGLNFVIGLVGWAVSYKLSDRSMQRLIDEVHCNSKALQESEERLQMLIENMQDFVNFKDGEGRWLVANRFGLSIFGLTGVSYRGLKDSELAQYSSTHHDALWACEATDEIAWNHGGPSRCDEMLPDFDSSFKDAVRIFDTIKIPTFHEDGRRRGLIVVGRDVTEKRREEQLLKDSEAYNKALFTDSHIASIVLDPLTAKVVGCNLAAARLHGFDRVEDVVGRTPSEFMQQEQYDSRTAKEVLLSNMQMAVEQGSYRAYVACRRSNGVLWDAKIHLMRIDHSGRPLLLVSIEDITEQKKFDEWLRLSAAVIDSTRDGVIITGPDASILSVNKAFTEITGYTAEEVVGRNPRLLQSGKQSKEFYVAMWQSLLSDGYWQGELWNRRKSGDIYPQLTAMNVIRDENNSILHCVAVFTDISKLKEVEARLQHLAYHDPLTGLPNRTFLQLHLDHVIEQARRRGSLLALHMIDLDRFKDVNDGYGHPAGDELLIVVANRLRGRLRKEDVIIRLGGDEFLVVQEGASDFAAVSRLSKVLIDTISVPVMLSAGNEVYVSASVGVAVFPDDANDRVTLLRNADTALYQAKAQGRHACHFYTPALTTAAEKRQQLEIRLRRALELKQFVVHYQPLLSLKENRIIGAEVLVRWYDPEVGLVPPDQFIAASEESGLIAAIGDQVIEYAMIQVRQWKDQGFELSTLAINVSARQFRNDSLSIRISELTQRYNLLPSTLEIEITELSLMNPDGYAKKSLDTLKEMGVRIAIDDFGTGYSSLSYLQQFPVDTLKIDRSFVTDIPNDENDVQIAQAILGIARSLNLQVVAEGIETEEQLSFFKERGCDIAQGYLIGRPLPASEFIALAKSDLRYADS